MRECDNCGSRVSAESHCEICGHELSSVQVIEVDTAEVAKLRAQNTPLGEICARLGLSPQELAFVLAEEGVDVVELDEHPPDPDVARQLPEAIARQHQAIPWRYEDADLLVAVADHTRPNLRSDLEQHLGRPVKLLLSSHVAVADAIDRVYPQGA